MHCNYSKTKGLTINRLDFARTMIKLPSSCTLLNEINGNITHSYTANIPDVCLV